MDRLSFRRFVGLGLGDPTLDHSTLSRFRETLVERGLGQALLAEFERQLNERGLLLKQGTLLDASVVESKQHRAHRWHPQLPHWHEQRNQLIEPRRRAVERVFGTFKRSYHYRRVRYRGVARNELELCFKALAFNLRKADQLHGAPA